MIAGDINDFLSMAGNGVLQLHETFRGPVIETQGVIMADSTSGTIGQDISNVFSAIGGGITGLFQSALDPITGELNFIVIAILVSIVVIVAILAFNAGDVSKIFHITALV